MAAPAVIHTVTQEEEAGDQWRVCKHNGRHFFGHARKENALLQFTAFPPTCLILTVNATLTSRGANQNVRQIHTSDRSFHLRVCSTLGGRKRLHL